MPVVHLVRHGQASFGADDYDVLSELGREQSLRVRTALAGRGLRSPVAVCGTLRRQRDTAALALPDVPAAVDGRWDEYDHLELMRRYTSAPEPGGSSLAMQRLLDEALRSWVHDGDDGGWSTFSDGAVDALGDLTSGLGSGRDAVVFTSGGVIAAVCAQLLGLGADGVVALNRIAVNGAVTKLAVGSRGTTLVTFNEHGHLDSASTTYR
ncbi:MAG: Phosphoglycerate mutase [Frankiales bacterium]|nr:Phosphoglycerate mutase [Frankiales bacterium]